MNINDRGPTQKVSSLDADDELYAMQIVDDVPKLVRVTVQDVAGSAPLLSQYASLHGTRLLPPAVVDQFPPVSSESTTRALGSTAITGTLVTHAYNSSRFTIRECIPEVFNQLSNDTYRNKINGTATYTPFSVDFDFYGDRFDFMFRDNAGSGSLIWVWADGKPLTAAPEPTGAVSAGSINRWCVTFAAGVALRRIRVYLRYADLFGIRCKAIHSVGPVPKRDVTSVWVGDSWVEGTSNNDIVTFARLAAIQLGWECYQQGQGGTGYVADGGGGNKSVFGSADRLARIVQVAPKYLVVCGSVNDDGSAASVQAAATAMFSSLATSLPDTKIIVVGPQSNGDTNNAAANRLANRTAVQAAAAAATNVLGFIDPVAGLWITGTGKVGSTTNDGPADLFVESDGVHVNAAGHAYYARRVAQGISALIANV